MADSLAAIGDNLPLVLSLVFVGLMMVGFWRGLSIRPRPADERAPERWH
jgi:hypothetical protein